MRRRRSRIRRARRAVPRLIRAASEVETARDVFVEQHKFKTLSLLGQSIKIKVVEFLPGIHNTGAETALDFISRGIEIACESLGHDPSVGVIPGVAPVIGIGTSSQDFFSAGNGIFGTLATFADKLSTVLARSTCFDPAGHTLLLDDDRSLRLIKNDDYLRGEWERFFLYGARMFFKDEPPERALTKRRKDLKSQLMPAIETFGLAQEYGQHIVRNARRTGEEKEIESFADGVALSIGQFLGARGFVGGTFSEYRNTWLESGAGTIALLSAVRCIRATRELLETGTYDQAGQSAYVERLTALEASLTGADGVHQRRFAAQRRFVARVIINAFNELKLRFFAAHKAGFRPIRIDAIKRKIEENSGLAEIITRDVGGTGTSIADEKAFARYMGEEDTDLTANSKALEDALKSIRQGKNEPTFAPDYLRHYQDRSVSEFAVSLVRGKVGIVDPAVESAVTKRLNVGRLDAVRAGLQDVINLHSILIEPMCQKLGFPLHNGIACGIAWNPASGAAQMTIGDGEGIILIPESVLMLCHFMGKFLAKALPVSKETERLAINLDPSVVLPKLEAEKSLLRYAAGAIGYCATWNRATLKPLPPTAGDERVLWYQLLVGTELFILAHEYAHHIYGHGVIESATTEGIPSDLSKVQELEADYLAAILTANIGVEKRLTFAQYGTAAVIALSAVDMLRRARNVLQTGKDDDFVSDTHPPLSERLVNLQRVTYDPREAESVRANQENCRALMDGIWGLLLPSIEELHKRGVRPLPVNREEAQWLPFLGDAGRASVPEVRSKRRVGQRGQ